MSKRLSKETLDKMILEAPKMVGQGKVLRAPDHIVVEGFIRAACAWLNRRKKPHGPGAA